MVKSIRFRIILIILVSVTAVGIFSGYLEYRTVIEGAKQKALAQIDVANALSRSILEYFDTVLIPNLEETFKKYNINEFILQAHSSNFADAFIFNLARDKYPDLLVRQVALNPINRRDIPRETERRIIEILRNTGVREIEGVEEFFGKKYFYKAFSVVAKKECIRCHTSPESMPRPIYRIYRPVNTQWKEGEVVGAVIIGFPIDVALQEAKVKAIQRGLMVGFASLLLGIIVVLVLQTGVFSPLEKLTDFADRLSKGETEEPAPKFGNLEMDKLSEALERLRVSLKKVIDLLK